MDRKYEMIPDGDMFRIKALRSFGSVEKGDFGGLIEKETNLSHDGDSWIAYGAQVLADAKVSGDAIVGGVSEVTGRACVIDNSIVRGHARIYGDAIIHGHAYVHGYARVEGYASVHDATVCDAHVFGKADVKGCAEICEDAEVSEMNDYIVFKNWWSSGRYFTWTRSNNKWKVGCFHGTGEELIQKAYQDYKEKGEQYEKIVNYVNSLGL